jgi:hypothetical protein
MEPVSCSSQAFKLAVEKVVWVKAHSLVVNLGFRGIYQISPIRRLSTIIWVATLK